MIKLSDKKRISLLILIVSSLLLTAFYSVPFSRQLFSWLDLLDPVFNEKTPVIVLKNGSLEFDGQIPFRIALENNIRIVFDETADDSVLADARPYSIFIATDSILFKSKKEIKRIPIEDIEIEKESVRISPVKVGRFLHKFSPLIIAAVGASFFLTLVLIFYLIALAAAGVGIMVDAFSNGPYSFGHLLNSSSLLLFLFSVIWVLFGFATIWQLRTLIIAYFLIFVTLVYWTIRSSRRIDVS